MRTVIETDRVFVRAVLDKAFFEKQTKLDAYRRPSQTDVLAILQTKSGVGISDVASPRKIPEIFEAAIAGGARPAEMA